MKRYRLLALLFIALLCACGGKDNVVTLRPTNTLVVKQISPTPSATIFFAPTATPVPTETPVPTAVPTDTPMPLDTPTATTQATATATPTEVATALPEDCWNAQYIADVTIPDGTRLDPGEVFVKTWRVRNTGACAWEGVTLQAKGLSPVDVPEVAAGAEAEVSAQVQAPAAEGEYTAVWHFEAPDGTRFGRLTSVIRVGDPATAVPPPTATSAPAAPQPTATTAAVCECGGDIYNCKDFSRQAQAQACYNYCVSIGRGDIHRLDRDNDGVVCESLP